MKHIFPAFKEWMQCNICIPRTHCTTYNAENVSTGDTDAAMINAAFYVPGLCYGSEHTVSRLDRRKTSLDVFSLRHQRRRLHHEGGDDGHCDCGIWTDGEIRWSKLESWRRARESGSYVSGTKKMEIDLRIVRRKKRKKKV